MLADGVKFIKEIVHADCCNNVLKYLYKGHFINYRRKVRAKSINVVFKIGVSEDRFICECKMGGEILVISKARKGRFRTDNTGRSITRKAY